MENTVVVNDYRQMDKIIKEERTYILNMVKKIKAAKCNVLLIQKSILRDAVDINALHFLKKVNIMCIKDIERDEVEFICKVRDKEWSFFILWCSMLTETEHWLQTNSRHRILHRRQTRRRRLSRRSLLLRFPHRQNHRCYFQIRRPNRLYHLSGSQQPRPGRIRALPPRRALRYPLSGQEKSSHRWWRRP